MVITDRTTEAYQQLKTSHDLDSLLEHIGDSRYVLLGEASHGTHEYYTWRAAITRRLIEEKDFSFIAVEGDWPDCYRINRFIKGYSDAGPRALDVLKAFTRWPTWMWANWEIAALTEWLHDHNRKQTEDRKIGFYGLDVYSLWESMDIMIRYLRKEDPKVAQLAIQALRCFEPYDEGHEYARAMLHLSPSCTDEVVKLLQEVQRRSHRYDHDREASLNVEMNAQVIANAEAYYRNMIAFRDDSWNVRDTHMADTLDNIMKFHGRKAKAIVWEHNTHVGDARFTDMKDAGMCNVGQLIRERHGKKDGVYIVGFASYQGTVIAGKEWESPMETMKVPPAAKGSIEYILHEESPTDRIVFFDNEVMRERFNTYRGHRAIGVVYNPASESGNYVPTLIPSRYDALLYLDQTKALHPLHLQPTGDQVPETYPFGF
jgi:erythromycin esterase